MRDIRAEVLSWLDEQETMARQPAWSDLFDGMEENGWRLALAALRAEVERHERISVLVGACEVRDECHACIDGAWPCGPIERIHSSLGLK